MTNNSRFTVFTMARPSSQADQALIAAGRLLYPAHGCAGLSVRRVAEQAGVKPGLFHYHFESKDAFLTVVLQGVYEDLFSELSEAASGPAAPLVRLKAVLQRLGRALRERGELLVRVLGDVAQGEPAALAFVQRNAPRHLGLLTGLMAEAERAGQIAPMPPLRRMGFVMGAVAAPLLAGRGLRALALQHPLIVDRLDEDMLSDSATEQRIEMVLVALCAGKDKPCA